MKKKNLYFVILMVMIALSPALHSCDDDGYSLGDYVVRMATVKVVSGNSYYLEADNGKTLWPAASAIPWYKPLDGQRVIANYTLLYDNFEGYDHGVKVNFLSNVLTKAVEELTEANEEEIGDDAVDITDMWVGGKYLNVEFLINLPMNNKHRVSLVKNTLVEAPDDGYIHLEYRYNDQDDVTGYWKRSMVSFNLGEYAEENASAEYQGIKIRINSAVNGERILVYNFSDIAGATKGINDADEVIDPDGKLM